MKTIVGRFAVNFLAAYGTMVLLNTMFSWDNPQLWMLSSAACLAVVVTLCISIEWAKVRWPQRDR